MKKLITTVLLAALGFASANANRVLEGIEIGELSASSSIGFESEYVFRGAKRAANSMQASLELGLPVYEGVVYGGVWSNVPTENKLGLFGNEYDLYFGYTLPVTDMFSVDAGYTYYLYQNDGRTMIVNRAHEFKFGVLADVMFSPAAYVYYNLNFEQLVLEASARYSYDLAEYGMEDFALEFAAALGYSTADKASGDQTFGTAVVNDQKDANSYIYATASADLVYTLNEVSKASVGVRYAGNNDGSASVANGLRANTVGEHENMLWWGAKMTFAF